MLQPWRRGSRIGERVPLREELAEQRWMKVGSLLSSAAACSGRQASVSSISNEMRTLATLELAFDSLAPACEHG